MKSPKRLFAALLSGAILLPGIAVPQTNSSGADYVEGEVLVTFKPSANEAGARLAATTHGLQVVRRFGWLSVRQHREFLHLRSRSATTAQLIADLKKDPSVAAVEPNYLRHFCDMRPPNDPQFSQLWAMRNTAQSITGTSGTAGDDISFLKGWGLARPATGEVVVAVIDSGGDYTHPDLAGNLWTNPGELADNGLDDDNDGYADDVHGYDFADYDGDPMDSGSHGTHVAGTIAAAGNNGVGVIGVAWRAHLMILKASSDGTSLANSAVIAAIQYATMMKQRGVNVVAMNASFGGGGSSPVEQAAIQAAGDAGIVLCAAAGNNALNNDSTAFYPASYRLPNMIVVAATDQNDNLANFSDYGVGTVDLAAPGVNILSTLPVSLAGATSYVQRASSIYAANELEYSGRTTGISGVIYDCGLGYPTNFPPAVNGNIALIQRGTLYFSEKVANAMAAGAQAAIIYNNTSGNFSGTLQTADNWIPSISLSQADGQALLASLPGTGVVVDKANPDLIYQYLNGTSMATPHVSGAVAFAAMNFPDESATERVQRIIGNVTPVPALQGLVITGGRLNLAKIVDTDGNGLPDWWEEMYFEQPTGMDPMADADNDGVSNIDEFLADTDPTDDDSSLRFGSVTRATNGVSLKWSSGIQARQYLQRKSNLMSGSWINVFTNEPPTAISGGYLDLSATNGTGVYRIRAERP